MKVIVEMCKDNLDEILDMNFQRQKLRDLEKQLDELKKDMDEERKEIEKLKKQHEDSILYLFDKIKTLSNNIDNLQSISLYKPQYNPSKNIFFK